MSESEVKVAVLLGSGVGCLGVGGGAGVGAGLGVAGFRLLAVTFCSALKTCPFKVWYCSWLNLVASDATKLKNRVLSSTGFSTNLDIIVLMVSICSSNLGSVASPVDNGVDVIGNPCRPLVSSDSTSVLERVLSLCILEVLASSPAVLLSPFLRM